MLKSKDAKLLSSFECEDRPLEELLQKIEKFIYEYASKKNTCILWMIDGSKYSQKTIKKAIKCLVKNGYKVKVRKMQTKYKNELANVELTIFWW